MKKSVRFAALFVAAVLTFTACSRMENASQDNAIASLPAPPPSEERQILGDTTTTGAREVTFYRASEGTMELTTVTRSIRAGADGNLLRSVLEDLLASLHGGGSLLIGGAQAALIDVELSCGLATVRLSIDASVNRSDQDYLLLCTSIANTLLGIEGVEAVNILTGDRSNPICALPSGLFTEQIDNVPAAYAQLQSERERFLEDGVVALERTAYLYFPAFGGQYLLPEVRELSFASEDYAAELIEALCSGPMQRGCCFSAVPANLELLDGAPKVTVTPEGERILELKLSGIFASYLALVGIEHWQLYGSLVLTLTSFMPELDALRIRVNDEYVTHCSLGTRSLSFPDGRMRRSDFESCIGGSAFLYFADEDNNLVRLECAVSQGKAASTGGILYAMFLQGDSYLPGVKSVFPEGIGTEDVLGVAIEGRTAVVNLSGNFYALCQPLDTKRERALVYAIVNALSELDSIGAVSFLVEGRQIDSLVGNIYLRTALMPEPGIVRSIAPQATPNNAAG